MDSAYQQVIFHCLKRSMQTNRIQTGLENASVYVFLKMQKILMSGEVEIIFGLTAL